MYCAQTAAYSLLFASSCENAFRVCARRAAWLWLKAIIAISPIFNSPFLSFFHLFLHIMAQKEAAVYILDLGRSMGEKRHGRNKANLDWALEYVWDKITTTVCEWMVCLKL